MLAKTKHADIFIEPAEIGKETPVMVPPSEPPVHERAIVKNTRSPMMVNLQLCVVYVIAAPVTETVGAFEPS
jgi:hypothetical protein